MNRDFTYYNDYIRITKQYLKNLNAFRVTLKNLRLEEASLQKELEDYDDIPSPTVSYQEKTAKAAIELTNVEAVVERRRRKDQRLRKLREKITRLDTLIRKIDNSIEALPDEERKLLEAYLIYGGNTGDVARATYCSERTVRYRTNNMVRQITGMLFGSEAVSVDEDFVFAE